MNIAEQIYALVNSLPPDEAQEILTFAEFVRAKHFNAKQVEVGQATDTPDTSDSMTWQELVYSLAGAWKDDFPSLEEIRHESGQDSLRERL